MYVGWDSGTVPSHQLTHCVPVDRPALERERNEERAKVSVPHKLGMVLDVLELGLTQTVKA